MDHFKAYNDTEGHSAGDELLQEASRAWAAELAPEGFLARWGGEEFAVALAGAAEPEVLARLEGLLAVVPRGQTCSIGVALWDRAEPPAAVLQRADEALYEAKSGGRNRLVLRTERPRPSVPAPRGETPLPVRAP